MITRYQNSTGEKILLIPCHLIETLYSIGTNHLPYEFGGILSGYRKESYDLVVDFNTPLDYKQSRTGFTRSAGDLNKYLKSIFDNTEGELEYMGEWHTHPFGSPEFSQQDYRSMREIANDELVGYRNPYLIILGIKQENFSHTVFRFSDNSLLELTLLDNL